MAVINSKLPDAVATAEASECRPRRGQQHEAEDPCERERLVACMELLFFAYRGFTSGPDAVLAKYNFGRAHHRVLHFVNRNPGLRVAELLDILRITKQSLARVLKQLIDQGFICQKSSRADRRARLLYTTAKGRDLAEKLADLQIARIATALEEAGPEARVHAEAFLAGMIDPQDRKRVALLTGGGAAAGRGR
jgi:DNA-binding MarR family transcriptional regulator